MHAHTQDAAGQDCGSGHACAAGSRSLLLTLLETRWAAPVLALLPVGLLAAFAAGIPTWACPVVGATGCRCPACGVTRSVAALGRGDLASSFTLHPLTGVLLVGWVVLATHCLLRGRARARFGHAVAAVEQRIPVGNVLLAAFLVFGGVRFVLDAYAAMSMG